MPLHDTLNIAICEDNPRDQETLLGMIRRCDQPASCTLFSSGEALLRDFQPERFDLLLMDIYMGGMSGVETIARIRELDSQIPVAFVTSSTDFALEGYRLSALKYIEKPVRLQDVADSLALARMKKNTAPALSLWKNGKEERVRFSELLYLEQQTHYLNLHLRDNQVLTVYEKLSTCLPQLEAQGFFSPHKSFSVNLSYVRSLDPELRCFVMQDGANIPIRRESMGQAKRALMDHLFAQTREKRP